MNIPAWGAEIWEEKNLSHDDAAVIMGTGFSARALQKNTARHLARAGRIFLKFLKPDAVIIDAGLGPSARFAVEFAKRGFKVIGVDASGEAVRRAQIQVEQNNLRLEFICADLCTFQVPVKADAVFCVETFFHLPAHLSLVALQNFNRALKPGGILYVQFAVQNEMTPGFLLHALIYMTAYRILRPLFRLFKRKTFYVTVARYSEAEIADLASRSGFVTKARENNFFLFEKTADSFT